MPKVKPGSKSGPKSGRPRSTVRTRGVPLQSQFQDAICKVFDYCEEERVSNRFNGELEFPRQRTKDILKVSCKPRPSLAKFL